MPKDKVTNDRIKLLHPAIMCLVTQAIDKSEASMAPNMAVRVVQGLRTIAEQNALYAKGRTSPGPKVTNAKGGQSIHNYGLAVDFALLIDRDVNGTFEELSWSMILDLDADGKKDWDEVVTAFESLGFSWGGKWRTFKDYPHCDMTFGYDWKWFLSQHEAGNFIPGTKFVNLG